MGGDELEMSMIYSSEFFCKRGQKMGQLLDEQVELRGVFFFFKIVLSTINRCFRWVEVIQ